MSETGFFTDTTLCIGCKACEVACKQWNQLPADGLEFSGTYDNTGELSGTTWRHVIFSEEASPLPSWKMLSDVCKHCEHAGCMQACPTGAIVRNEFGNVFVQPDVCNGCGYCVPSCPFGVVDLIPPVTELAPQPDVIGTALQEVGGVAGKCTLCYDRQRGGQTPACAKACPTDSIQFGNLAELRERAERRVEHLRERGTGAQLYGERAVGSVGTLGAFFLLTDAPETYGLPSTPRLPSKNQPAAYASAGAAALIFFLVAKLIFRTG